MSAWCAKPSLISVKTFRPRIERLNSNNRRGLISGHFNAASSKRRTRITATCNSKNCRWRMRAGKVKQLRCMQRRSENRNTTKTLISTYPVSQIRAIKLLRAGCPRLIFGTEAIAKCSTTKHFRRCPSSCRTSSSRSLSDCMTGSRRNFDGRSIYFPCQCK